jgi:protein SCO1/2
VKDYLELDPHLKADREPMGGQCFLPPVCRKVPPKDGDYTMDHTALVYLMDRDGLVAPFNLKRTPEKPLGLKRYLWRQPAPAAKRPSHRGPDGL